jgi:hypothetical protein
MLVVSAKASRTGRCRPDDVRAAARAEPRPTGSSCRMTFRAAARAEPRPAGRGVPRLGRSLALPAAANRGSGGASPYRAVFGGKNTCHTVRTMILSSRTRDQFCR